MFIDVITFLVFRLYIFYSVDILWLVSLAVYKNIHLFVNPCFFICSLQLCYIKYCKNPSPEGNDRSPEVKSHFKKHINGPWKPDALNQTHPSFYACPVTNNFDDDSIKNEWASMETPFSHYKSMGNFLDAQGQLTP